MVDSILQLVYMKQRTINITGSARNMEGGAMLVAENVGIYRVDGIRQWEQDWVGQRIKIIGDLEFRKRKNYHLIRNPMVQLLG
ncbi:MAG: hypothetical protein KAX45_07345 [Chitinophagaceae bacterium]|nr:hypothetical protein [Chitinophagaceae bacterium]MBP6591272.1 hypothetical protein [Chitinophagaceae bacterium]MBP8244336.1 hypothetical protein [Chitinophagaceae bacterium]